MASGRDHKIIETI